MIMFFFKLGNYHSEPDCHVGPHNNVSKENNGYEKNQANFHCFRFISVSNALPKTSYIKMIDIWLIFNLVVPFLEVILLFIKHFYKQPVTGTSSYVHRISTQQCC